MLPVYLVIILVMVLFLFQFYRGRKKKGGSQNMGSGMLSSGRVKVECQNCHQTYPAVADRLDIYSDSPQNYTNCPYCHKPTKVIIVR